MSGDFKECAECAAKPGTPALCASCLHNRMLISKLSETVVLPSLAEQQNALNKCLLALEPLDSEGRRRVIATLRTYFGLSGTSQPPHHLGSLR